MIATERLDDERRRATLIGAGAVLLWGTLAVLTLGTGDIPPFQLVAMTFALAFALALCKWVARGQPVARQFRQPARAWAIGVGGLFGYHFCIYAALKNAPPVEANLLNYLWPLLIVLFSAALPGNPLRARHILGGLAGFAGTVLLLGGGGALSLESGAAFGYGAALLAALIWATYSVANSRLTNVPTDAVGAFCLATAGLAAVSHLAFEATVVPNGAETLAILALGIGPAGGAFFLWDYGLKRGSVRALGTAGYAAPLVSTALLIAFAGAGYTVATVLGGTLVVGGAALAAGDMFRRSPI